MSDDFKNRMLAAADHIRSCNEAQDEIDRREAEKAAFDAQLHEYIAHEIRLAMQQESLEHFNGLSRAAVADIRASMIMHAIGFDVQKTHVTSIPSDHIDRKVSELIQR